MINKYNAQKAYWHPKCGYFKGKEAFTDYLQQQCTEQDMEIIKDGFHVFDSGFEADIHKLLYGFCAKNPELRLFTQVKIDLSQPTFCNLGYKVDFCIGIIKKIGFKAPPFLDSYDGVAYDDIHKYIELKDSLLVEVKGMFLPESRFKHLLLETNGIRHGKDIEIVQATPAYVTRGTKCYRTISPSQLLDKLKKQFNKQEE